MIGRLKGVLAEVQPPLAVAPYQIKTVPGCRGGKILHSSAGRLHNRPSGAPALAVPASVIYVAAIAMPERMRAARVIDNELQVGRVYLCRPRFLGSHPHRWRREPILDRAHLARDEPDILPVAVVAAKEI